MKEMLPEYSNRDLPTWIIATMVEDEGEDFPMDILKIWPKREKIYAQSGRMFNIMLDSYILVLFQPLFY